jgi:hypothetical protein
MPIELKDKIAIYISLAALFVSIVTPIGTYYWLDPKLKEVRDQQLIYDFQDFSRYWKLKKTKADAKFSDFYQVQYMVILENTGSLPVKNVVLSARPRVDSKATVSFTPPMPFDRRNDADTTYFTLKQPVGPSEKLNVWIGFQGPEGFEARDFTPEEEAEKTKLNIQSESCVLDTGGGCDISPNAWVSSDTGWARRVPMKPSPPQGSASH